MKIRLAVCCVCVVAAGIPCGGRAERPSRNIFWPIGRVESGIVHPGEQVKPQTKIQVPEHQTDWEGARKQINLSGLSRLGGRGPMALIDGALYKENDILAVSYKGLLYRFRILKIDDRGLSLSKEGVGPDSSPTNKGR
ncbi:MAG: hypothetical protein KBA51_00280 [Kiritimatiellae bacterium]|nr:hypothetical protein [Kiritimatiellia bacterium]